MRWVSWGAATESPRHAGREDSENYCVAHWKNVVDGFAVEVLKPPTHLFPFIFPRKPLGEGVLLVMYISGTSSYYSTCLVVELPGQIDTCPVLSVGSCAKGKILELWSRGLRKDKPRERIKCYLAKGIRMGFRINLLANDQRRGLVIYPLVGLRFQVR